jgi:divalent metal cation (Fe/Co/Zn/Cd) transporter
MNRLTEYIKGTRWAKFAAVVMIVFGALGTVANIVSLVLSIFTIFTGIFAMIPGIKNISSFGGILFGALGISASILTVMANIKLWRTANNLEIYTNSEKEEDLRDAIENLSAYFILIGWIAAISLAMLALGIISGSLWFRSPIPSMPGLLY